MANTIISDHADGASPEHEASQIPLNELYVGFEGLGNNCEFGIVQRDTGYDPPGLFRNVGYDYIEAMIGAIDRNLDGMFDEGNYEFTHPPSWHDWRLDDKRFGFLFHTAISPTIERDSKEWKKKTKDIIATFRFLKRLFQDDLKSGEKIFVFRMIKPVDHAIIEKFLKAIRKHGPGWLLYVKQDPAYPEGVVNVVEDGLMIGAIDRLSNENPPQVNNKAWENIARKAIAIKRASRTEA